MSFNGSGTFVINSTGQPVVVGTTISDTVFNAFTADIATGLSTCLTIDGQSTPTANIKFGGFKITGIANGTVATDAAALGQLQNGIIPFAVAGGTAQAITATFSPTVTALVDGMQLNVRALLANTATAPTFAPDGLTARAITKLGGVALVAGDIFGPLHELLLRYNIANTRWELLNPYSGSGTILEANTTSATGGGGSFAQLLSLALTPGKWRLSATVSYSGTANDSGQIAISTTTASSSGAVVGKSFVGFAISGGGSVGGTAIAPFDVTISANTTYYLNGKLASNADVMSSYFRAELIG